MEEIDDTDQTDRSRASKLCDWARNIEWARACQPSSASANICRSISLSTTRYLYWAHQHRDR